ncbi:MAG: hypothetical protein B0D92_01245 [Spirochaeta sp. LUC14_002_19_P3]|nr:MAG: hypothetical protein B0D92_01245 [Spirochaeta sp. LUC14_002_19_P3]
MKKMQFFTHKNGLFGCMAGIVLLIVGLTDCSQGDNPTPSAFSAVFKDGTGGVDGLDAAQSVAVSKDGKNVYVTGGLDNALAVFTRDTSTGSLTYSTVFKDGTGGVDGLGDAVFVTVSQDGKNVYVAGYGENALAVFNRDTSTGELTYSAVIKDNDALTGGGNVDGLEGATAVAVSQDGKNVYVAGRSDRALAVFTRDTTGALTFSTVFKDGSGGVDGINGASSVVVSEDGKNVYVAGSDDNALAVFNRDTSTGALTYSAVIKDNDALTGGGNVDGLESARSLTISQDGKNVYVAGSLDSALAVFNRDTSTGVLTFSTVFKDGTDGVDGLDGAWSVAVSEDGENVYVAGWEDNALAVFTLDTSTGALTFSTVFKDGTGGVDGLFRASSVAVSKDGKNSYVTGYLDDAVAVFTWK